MPSPRQGLTGRPTGKTLLTSKDYPQGPTLRPGGPQGVPHHFLGVPVTETRDDSLTWLTQEAYDRLKSELDHLSGTGRIEIAGKIEAAREEGDLREDGGYHPPEE